MPSRLDRAIDVTRDSLWLATVPAVATLLSFSKVARALAVDGGGGVTFPFPAGLPTLWTYVSLPGGTGAGGPGGPLALIAFVPLFALGLVVTSALEAGFLGALAERLDGEPGDFAASVRRFTPRIVGVNLIRMGVVLAALPLLMVPPLAVVVVLGLSYLLYGLPFEVVARDAGIRAALEATVERALDGGDYAAFGAAHLLVGAVASLALTGLVRNTGILGVLLGTALVCVPAVFVAAYGLLLFREDAPGAPDEPADTERREV